MKNLGQLKLEFFVLLGLALASGCRTPSPERIWADTRINDQPVRFAYDTGAEATVLFTRPAERLNLRVVNPPFFARPGSGKVLMGHAELCRFSVGKESYFLRLQTVRLPWPANRLIDVDGAIGWPDMKDDFIGIDAAHGIIHGLDQSPEKDTNGWFSLPLYPRTGVLAVQTTRSDGKTGVWEIDTGNDGGISLSVARWKEWRATHPRGRNGWNFGYMPGSGIGIGRAFTPDEFVFGPLTWKKITVRKATPTEYGVVAKGDVLEGSLGIKALRQLDVIVDQKNGRAFFRSRMDAGVTNPPAWMASTQSAVRLDFRDQESFDLASDAFDRGNLEKAQAIVTEYLARQPNNAPALLFRGSIRYASQQWDEAIQDFNQASELDADIANYAQFYVWILRARAGQRDAASRDLDSRLRLSEKPKADPWESKIGAFLLDRLPEAEFLFASSRSPGDTGQHQCEAWFYVGMKHRLAGDNGAARRCFDKCVATERKDEEEYHFAVSELKMLN